MSSSPVQTSADEIGHWLAQVAADLNTPNSPRNRIAGASFHAALQHFNAIKYLTANNGHTTAFALLRVEWQALLNGLWMHLCCPDEQVMDFWSGNRQFGKFPTLIKNIEAALERLGLERKPFSELRDAVGTEMHNFTHMGHLQIQALNSHNEIGGDFGPKQVDALLIVASRIALYSVTAIAWMRSDDVLEAKTLDQFETFHQRITQIGAARVQAVMQQLGEQRSE